MAKHRIESYVAPALFLGLLFFGCSKPEEKPVAPVPQSAPAIPADATVIATVGSDPITFAEYQERLTRFGFKFDADLALQVKEEFLNSLIERKMMLREAQRRRIKISQPDISKRIESLRADQVNGVKDALAGQGIDFEKWKNDVWEDLMIERLLAREVNGQITVSSAEIHKYYQEHAPEFERAEQVRVRQIVVTTEADAIAVLGLLQKKPDFAAMARVKSTAPEAEQGGDLGYFSPGQMPAEFDVVFLLPRGGMSGVVKSPYGFHIFKLENKRPAGRLSFDEASPEIRIKLLHEKQDRRYQQWLKELRSRTTFEVNYQALGR